MSNTNQTKTSMSFLAIDPYVETNIILPTEKISLGGKMVTWGDNNSYPDYLMSLYKASPTLKTCVDGTRDYICGDDVKILPLLDLQENVINKRGDTIREQVQFISRDLELYGGFALQIIRNLAGEVCEIYPIDMRFLRTNADCNVFYYSEDWSRSYGRKKVITYPCFMPGLDWKSLDDESRKLHASSILYVKEERSQTYPMPKFIASVPDCEIEKCIASYHLNNINNCFTPSVVINFNNGIPTDEVKEEIERDVQSKFSGHQNAGRILLSWNPDKDSQTTIREVKVDDFAAKYDALSKSSKERIFMSFRANPNLFGIATESNGFNSEEYDSAFKLFNRTQIKPCQRLICDAYDKIYGMVGVMTIIPFSMDGSSESNVQ